MRSPFLTAFAACSVLALVALASAQGLITPTPPEDVVRLPPVMVIAPSPLAAGGVGIDRDKIPATTQSLSADDVSRLESPNLTDALFQRIPGLSLSDPHGNSAQQEIRYRGFAASPLQGRPQGLAVYMNGIRINEAFGDTVNWDLVPTNAIQRVDVWSSNPVFGLNALGGAISLQMKNGFDYHGFEADVMGGSFGRVGGGLQYGAQQGDVAVYVAVQGLRDDGWRDQSPTEIGRLYLDLGWRNDRAEVHLIGAVARSSFGAAAATPIQLLGRDERAIYTNPQTTDNEMAMLALNGRYAPSESWSVQGNVYVRAFKQAHVDGNAAELERCSNSASPQFRDHLCLEDDGFPRPSPLTTLFRDQFVILDQNGKPIPCPPGSGNTCAPIPYGTIDRTETKALTFGVSAQATHTGELFGHGNYFTVGASLDRSAVEFTARSMLGFINPDLSVTTVNPRVPGLGSIIHTLGDVGVGSVDVTATNTYSGVYALDTFDITDRLSATLGGRLNVATISLRDQLGTSPELNSDATYHRFNPLVGVAYKIRPGVSIYAGYAESNRVPTPLENGCSNPAKPCLIESFLVADPPLKQVVGRTYEAGLRGNVPVADGRLDWKLGLFRTDSDDDIVQVASVILGRGVFQNVPRTRRQGLETSLQYQSPRWLAYASYSFLDATYQFTGTLPSPNNPFADEEGNVRVAPGRHLPGIPAHQGKFGLDYRVTPAWKIGGDVAVVGSQYFVGDDANQNVKLPGYWVANVHTSYQIARNVEVFALVNNLFDKRYAPFGTFFDPQGVANAGLPIALTDRRTEVFGPPRSIYGGVRVRF
ncbi:MAG TPA: TonB-dependent receptor [Candidatus Acidoferrum sp.]|nr:TonB-dependent receptor [Candidatus Acidoferrum sp.]